MLPQVFFCSRALGESGGAVQGEVELPLSFILAPVHFLFLPRTLAACPRVDMCSHSHPDASRDSSTAVGRGEKDEKAKVLREKSTKS